MLTFLCGTKMALRMAGWMGLPAMRDPETLALSALAQVVARFDEFYLRPPAA